MEPQDLKSLAQQLRKPEGDKGKVVANQMNDGNLFINRLTIENLEIKPGDKILEVGMGNGAFVKEIVERESSVKYVGCDFSETMIAEAQNLNRELVAAGRADFVLSSLNNLPFPDGTFNTVFTVNTIYFWEDPEKELGEIKRVLKKGGKLHVALRPKSVMKDMPFVEHGFQLFDKEDVESLLISNGLVVIKIVEEPEPEVALGELSLKMATLIIIAEKA